MCSQTVRYLCALCALLAVLLLAGPVRAERKYVFGTNCDFMGGVGDRIGNSSFNPILLKKGAIPFYSVYPSFTLHSIGPHSTLDLNYTFVGERFEIDRPITTTSHAFTGTLASHIGKSVHMRLSNTFSSVPAFSILNVLKGTTETPEGFQYVFEPELYKRSSISDNARAGFDIDLTRKSFLTFEGSGSYRHYERDIASPGYLSDQFRVEGSAAFSHRHSERSTWTIKYRMYQNETKDLPAVRSHTATLGAGLELRPTVRMTLEAGSAYTEESALNPAYVGYFASLSLSKQVHAHQLRLFYTHRPGDSTGLGTVTDSHQGGLGIVLALSRTTALKFDASAFKQNQRETLLLDYWGAQGVLALSRLIGRHWIVSIGGSYQIYAGRVIGSNTFAYRRAFISFGYRLPELWRFAK